MLSKTRGRKFSNITAHKLSLQTGAELGRVTTQETQRLIPSTLLLERIPSAARTYIADQGLNPVPTYAGRDAAEGRGDLHRWKQEQTLPLVCSQMGRKQGRVYGFYEPFLKKVDSVKAESGPEFRLGQSNRNHSPFCS